MPELDNLENTDPSEVIFQEIQPMPEPDILKVLDP